GKRLLDWDAFFVSTFVTARAPDELLTEVIFPVPDGFSFQYREFARHRGDFPVAGVCIGLSIEDGVVRAARLAATGVADRPVRLHEAEAATVGIPIDTPTRGALQVAALAADSVEPPADVHGTTAFRRGILATLVRRTITNWRTGDDA
ncbi:MAG: FAD binding domain-containing protein, partial [Haloechinothrix sp.]